jgi:uncharacterized protein (TIGR02444 family)
MKENPFTQYALELYQRPGVEATVLQLQERFAADITMLLYSCWLAAEGRQFTEEAIQSLQQTCASWRGECVLGLRKVRRYLKTLPEQEALYKQLKQIEIQTELTQMQWMWQAFEKQPLPFADNGYVDLARENLTAYCRLLPGAEWNEVAELINELLPLTEQ